MTTDGKYEAIYSGETGERITDPRDIGTYNYYNPDTNGFMHVVVDVLPWILWRNSEDDTTTVFDRIWYSIKGPKWFK